MARIDGILKLVQEQGASDLHLTTGSPPMVRIHGEIVPVPYEELTPEVAQVLMLELMNADLRARYERERDVDFSYEVPGMVRMRCNIYEQSRGMAGSFRLLPERIPTLEDLGLPPSVAGFAELRRGLILVTGPPGSGKSSTLAALVEHINGTQPRHILTLEDPIEFRHANRRSLVTQREVARHTPSFARGMRAARREDPDVILVGELPDPETLALAITSAASGPLVLAALHGTSAAQAVDRILDSFDGEHQSQVRLMLAECLRAVVAQRLIRRADGAGRVLAAEILTGTPAVAALIRDQKTSQLPAVLRAGRREGMQALDDAVLELVRDGVVSVEDAAIHVGTNVSPAGGPVWPGHPGAARRAA